MASPLHPLTVPPDLHGATLLDFLQATWPEADRTALRRGIESEEVLVNAMPATGVRQRVRTGDHVQAPEPRRRRQAAAASAGPAEALHVLHEEPAFLVVDKPSGLATVPDRAGKDPGVHGRLAALRPEADLRIVHRLDRETSGCLILACGLEAARFFDLAFREARVAKRYLALVEGVVRRDAIEVRRPLGPDRRRPGKVRVVDRESKGAREAHTRVEVLERFRDHTLVACMPSTGRGHQLRVHLASLGHPIVGDVDYGAARELLLSRIKRGYKARTGAREVPLVERLFLHAAALDVPRPDGGVVHVESPLPAPLVHALTKLRRFAAMAPNAPEIESP